MFHESVGTIRYGEDYKLVVEVDQELARFYRSLIPKWIGVTRPRWPAHITVVRSEKESPVDLSVWGKYEGYQIKFLYNSDVQFGKIYYWLDVLCKDLEEIRKELGMSVTSQYTRPPDGFSKYFHCTIANLKDI